MLRFDALFVGLSYFGRFPVRTRMKMAYDKCAALPAKIAILMLFQKIVSKTQHKNEHLASTKRSFQEILKECLKNRPQGAAAKKRVKRIFITKEKTRERINFHKVLFFIIRTAVRTKRKKHEKARRGDHAVNNASK